MFVIPWHRSRHNGPSTSEMMLQLQEKLQSCILSRSLTKREFQGLVGMFRFTTKVVRPGRMFLHKLYVMQQTGRPPFYHINLHMHQLEWTSFDGTFLWTEEMESQFCGIFRTLIGT